MDAQTTKRVLRRATGLTSDLQTILGVQPRQLSEARKRGDATVTSSVEIYDSLIRDAELVVTTRDLFVNRHYALSVEEGFKYINNLVKARSGLSADGADLMNRALSVANPVLKLSDLKNQSQRDQQLGYMLMLAGVMSGVRNPRAHEHRYLDEPHVALELLAFADHLAGMVRGARRARRRRVP